LRGDCYSCRSSGELTAARRTGEDGGHVLEELQPAVERPAGDQFARKAETPASAPPTGPWPTSTSLSPKKVGALYSQPKTLPADIAGPKMTRLRRDHSGCSAHRVDLLEPLLAGIDEAAS
jgi:hypothetical protein